MQINHKTIGYLLIGLSIILFIILTIVKLDIDEQATIICQKFHETPVGGENCPVHQNNSVWFKISWMLTAAFGLSFLIFGVGVYLAFFYKTSMQELKKEFNDIDLSKLDDEEKKIYDILKEKKGSAYQSDLIKETGLSKVKITRVLDKMETGDIIERKRRGMTNIVVLK